MTSPIKLALVCILSVLVSACAVPDPENEVKAPLGDFSLGHNVVVTKNARRIGPSRTASPEEWETVLEGALDKRFGGYDGEKLYHFGINLDGYVLAVPGLPVVLSPKSALVVSVTIWDDAAGKKLNAKPRQLTIFEQLDGGTIVGSGLTRKRDEQMANLAAQFSKAIERYLVANADWFGAESSEEAKAAAEADVLKIPQDAAPVAEAQDPVVDVN